MPTTIETRNHINAFEDVKVQTTKALYLKLGERVPKQPQRGGVCVLGLSKIDKIEQGSILEIRELKSDADALRQQIKSEIQEPVKQEPVKQVTDPTGSDS